MTFQNSTSGVSQGSKNQFKILEKKLIENENETIQFFNYLSIILQTSTNFKFLSSKSSSVVYFSMSMELIFNLQSDYFQCSTTSSIFIFSDLIFNNLIQVMLTVLCFITDTKLLIEKKNHNNI